MTAGAYKRRFPDPTPEAAAILAARRLHLGRVKKLATFGLTVEQYDAMFQAQGGVCAICGRIDPHRRLSVDHDHATGEIRGLLCAGCNRGLGDFGDDFARMNRAIDYLLAHRNGLPPSAGTQ